MLRRTLPQLEGTIALPGLRADVLVERDALGVPHIRAQSLEDLLTAQGYVVAQDRLWQMDLLRRAAAGELSEIFGEVAFDHDVESRTLGFAQAADAALAAMPPDRRAMLEAYARGVNLYLEQRSGRLPAEFLLLRYTPRPWAARDTLLIAANLYKELTGFWKEQMLRADVSQAVGPQRADDLYAATADSPWDHVLAGATPETPKPHRGGGRSPQRCLRLPLRRVPNPNCPRRPPPRPYPRIARCLFSMMASAGPAGATIGWLMGGGRTPGARYWPTIHI
jgi:penicillin amidase